MDIASGLDVLRPDTFATITEFDRLWNIWPPGIKNTVGKVNVTDGALQVTLTNPPDGAWPDFHLHSRIHLSFAAHHTYRVSFQARASAPRQIHTAVYQVSHGQYIPLGGPPGPFLSEVALARDVGVHLVSFSAPNCWGPPELPTQWQALDELCQKIIAINPSVLLVPRVESNAPDWFLERHPEAHMVYDGGQTGRLASVSHRGYRVAAAAHLEKLCRHLTETFPDHFAGIHACGQNTGEWFYEGSWERPLSGYDEATRVAFRTWLAERGLTKLANDPPSPEARRAHPFGLLRDPAEERPLLEFARFQQREMADMVLTLAAAARRGTAGRKLVIFFYGYPFEFPPLANGAPTSGHYALAPVLKSRDIDILCSPVSYFDRDWLGTGPAMSCAESVNRAGILWLNEDDTRTFLDTRTAEHTQEGGLVNVEQTRQVMLRNTAQAALRGFGTWWMDLPGEGWFNDAAIWEVQKQLRPIEKAVLQRRHRFQPEIAAILGEDSMCHLTGGSSVMAKPLIYDARASLGRSGAPYGQYTLDDAAEGRVSAKLQIFLAAWSLSDAQRQGLSRRRPAHTTRVWCWAPGMVGTDRRDLAGMAALTGFQGCFLTNHLKMLAQPTPEGNRWGLKTVWGIHATGQPLLTVAASEAETLAVYPDGSPALAVRHSRRGQDVFMGVPAWTPELAAALARMAGVHLFTGTNAAVWAADGLLSVQAHHGGPMEIHTGRARPVVDALTGQRLGRGPTLALPMEAGAVRVLRY